MTNKNNILDMATKRYVEITKGFLFAEEGGQAAYVLASRIRVAEGQYCMFYDIDLANQNYFAIPVVLENKTANLYTERTINPEFVVDIDLTRSTVDVTREHQISIAKSLKTSLLYQQNEEIRTAVDHVLEEGEK